MVALSTDGQDEGRWVSIAADISIEQLGIDGHNFVLFQWLARRQLVVGSKAFPLDGSECVPEQGFQQLLVDALAIRAIGHDQNARLAFLEAGGVVSPALGVAFFEKGFAIRSPVQSPR